jgi:hypothetical protein
MKCRECEILVKGRIVVVNHHEPVLLSVPSDAVVHSPAVVLTNVLKMD